jgi:hypothetical protein
MRSHRAALVVGVLLLALASDAAAYDPEQTFSQGAFVLSPEASYGRQFNFEDKPHWSRAEFWNVGTRFGVLPFSSLGRGTPLYGSLETGLEPLYQRYVEPSEAFFAGLGAVVRYHFLSLGRVVPYLEAAGFAGGTDLRVKEVASDFSFVAFGGIGASIFVTDHAALYGGYRWEHISNGDTSKPNRGLENHVGVAGVSFFFH